MARNVIVFAALVSFTSSVIALTLVGDHRLVNTAQGARSLVHTDSPLADGTMLASVYVKDTNHLLRNELDALSRLPVSQYKGKAAEQLAEQPGLAASRASQFKAAVVANQGVSQQAPDGLQHDGYNNASWVANQYVLAAEVSGQPSSDNSVNSALNSDVNTAVNVASNTHSDHNTGQSGAQNAGQQSSSTNRDLDLMPPIPMGTLGGGCGNGGPGGGCTSAASAN